MKVYATTINKDGSVGLRTFPSKKAFEAIWSWCDPRWIAVATTVDLETYEFPYERGMVVRDEYQIASHNILHDVYKGARK